MSSIASLPAVTGFTPSPRTTLPDHLQLPESDGLPVDNLLEHPQSILLTTSLWPILEQRHPDHRFAVGQSSGIYFKVTDPPLEGCRAPDWFYVPNVPPDLNGTYRRSYVMWQELQPPLLLMEFVSGNGAEERDPTPDTGKFWIYERAIRAGYYLIFDPTRQILEGYRLVNHRFERMTPNQRGHLPFEPLGIEFGLWHGTYLNLTIGWLRAWDSNGRLVLLPEEIAEVETRRAKTEKQRADVEKKLAEVEKQRAEAEKQRADRLAAQLRALGLDPDQV